MSDLISRQAAIEAVCEACGIEGDHHKCDGFPDNSDWCESLVAIRAVPSAQKPGKWIDGWRGHFDGTKYWFRKCSVCDFERDDDNPDKDTNYCPNCGAKMDGGKDDE